MKKTISVKDFKKHIEYYCYLRTCLKHQQSSIIAMKKDLNVFIMFLNENKTTQIKGKTIVEFLAYLSNKRNNGSGAINRKKSSLCTYLKHLALSQIPGAESFPFEHVPRARDPYAGPIKTLEIDEVKCILYSIDKSSVLGYRDYLLYSMLYALGLRLGEALNINIDDFNWNNNCLTILGKGRKIRKIPIINPIKNIIDEWLILRKSILNADTSEALFMSKKGNRLALRTAEDNFKKYIKKTDRSFSIDKITPHTLRHAFASHAIEKDADLIVLKTILGHASLKTTEIYLHPSMNMLKNAINDHLASDILRDLQINRVGVLKIQSSRPKTNVFEKGG